jgi:hypothetical protein
VKVQNKFRNNNKSWDRNLYSTLRGTKQEKGISRARNRIRTGLTTTRRETEITLEYNKYKVRDRERT